MATAAPIMGAPTRAPGKHTACAPRAPFLNILPRHRRLAIEGEIEMCLRRVELLIARLDDADAPIEDLEDDDPAGDPLELIGEADSDDGRGLLAALPAWAIDQTVGPENYHAASREYLAAEIGLVQSPTGGWRQA